MPLNPSILDIGLRILLAIAAGAIIGFNREGRNEAAGLRTTVLVCLAACLAMVLANLLLPTDGKQRDGFVQIDVMRLPLGILSGMGFLGAGAIIKRGDSVLGVTTAATLWFMTVIGLAFGAGEYGLGVAGTVIAFAVVWGLKRADERMHHRQRGSLTLCAEAEKLSEGELRRQIHESDLDIESWAITYFEGGTRYEAHVSMRWRGAEEDRTRTPELIEKLARAEGVVRAEWRPQALSG